MAEILKPTDENLRILREFLRLGGLVAVPTETVYGLAANALDADACAKIFEAKKRPSNDPLICHVASYEALEAFCETNEASKILAEAFWPGPLTFVLPKKDTIPSIVTADLDSVAVRSPNHPVFRQLIEGCDFPLAAPSANPFAYISPTRASHVEANLGDRIEYILEGGPCEYGVESTIVDLRDPTNPKILRYGALPVEKIENALKKRLPRPTPKLDQEIIAIAPGSLPKHYSPRTPLELRTSTVSERELIESDQTTAYLLIRKPKSARAANIHWLSEKGKLETIASSLFAKLRELDDAEYQRIIAEEAPELGLGLAINDRLRRASFR
jgi:L-threonylcarbamoyladenylate synthase|tara:strand:- start:776 stop:1759 length:984 start_codon:yes stop_codon:yes gene_type:complete